MVHVASDNDEASLAARAQGQGWFERGRRKLEAADQVQLKCYDPNGIHLDVVNTEYGRRHWRSPV